MAHLSMVPDSRYGMRTPTSRVTVHANPPESPLLASVVYDDARFETLKPLQELLFLSSFSLRFALLLHQPLHAPYLREIANLTISTCLFCSSLVASAHFRPLQIQVSTAFTPPSRGWRRASMIWTASPPPDLKFLRTWFGDSLALRLLGMV